MRSSLPGARAKTGGLHARDGLYRVIKEVSHSDEPLTNTGRENSAVPVSGDDGRAIQENRITMAPEGRPVSWRESGGVVTVDAGTVETMVSLRIEMR